MSKSWRILAIDDDRLTRTLLESSLCELGAVTLATSGEDALQRLETEPLPDLILLDAMMPGISGFDVLAKIRSDPVLAAIPVMLVTGHSDQKTETQALEAGAVDFISKPLNLPAVKARARTQLTLIDQRRSLQIANEALRDRIAERNSEIESLLRFAPDPIWFKNLALTYVAINPAALRAFGRTEDEVIGHSDHDLFSTEIATMVEARDRAVIDTGNNLSFEREICFPDTGKSTFLEVLKTPVRDAHGIPIGVLSIARDITLRKATEIQLRLLSLAVDQNPNPIFITNSDKRIEYVNDAFSDMTGYPVSEAIGKDAGFNRSGHTPASVYVELRNALKEGRAWKGRFYNRTRDGSDIINEAHIVPLSDASARISHYLAILEDITEHERMTAEISQTRAAVAVAEAASEAKSRFLANMSHEIRTPMNAIIGLTNLLLDDHPLPRQKKRLDQVADAAEHLLSVINDILDISKIEAGRLELTPVNFSIVNVVTKISALVSERVDSKGLLFSTSIANLPAVLHGDAMRLTQILLNYVANAIKFTDRGCITLKGEVLEETSRDVLVRFSVKDSGVGIAPENLPRLFKAFEQADDSISRKFGGTGLGLRINRYLAKMMGGDVGVDSAQGVGSTFWATLRLGKLSAEEAQDFFVTDASLNDAALSTGNFSSAHVLLAEDNPVNQEVALAQLLNLGVTADLASNGAEAIAAASARTYDLILMDMQMPEIDGLTATQSIRRLAGYATTPIIAMTANAFNQDRQACLDAGMNDHLAKPVRPELLHATLLKWLPKSLMTESPTPDTCGEENSEAPKSGLDALPGLDYALGLKQLSGNVEVYEDLLRKFVTGTESDLAAIAQHLDAIELDKVRRLAHRLRGAAGALGAMRLHELAGNLEDSIRKQEPATAIEIAAGALAMEFKRLSSAMPKN